jgi:hypothetical protein
MMPKVVILSDIKVYVPAMDPGRTSDLYLTITYVKKVAKQQMLSQVLQGKKVTLVQMKVRKKVLCPAWETFDEVSLAIPVWK